MNLAPRFSCFQGGPVNSLHDRKLLLARPSTQKDLGFLLLFLCVFAFCCWWTEPTLAQDETRSANVTENTASGENATTGEDTTTAALASPLAVDASVLQAQQKRVEVMKRAAAATISIFGLDGGGGGSGVIVTPDGYALTNYHVSSACGDHMRCGLNDGKMYDAVIVGIDATGDVSLIKLLGRDDFPTAPLADSNQVRVGQWCFSAGNPFVLASNLQPSISLGLVSGVHRYQYPAGTLLEYADCVQTDAAVNPGNSGGPLFNLAGEVIGINGRCSFEKRGRINVGVGYAISANQIKYFMGVLMSGRLVDHATLGATVSTDAPSAEEASRVRITNILSSSDAYRRGLRFGDEVIALADREVKTTNTFKNILGTLPKDWRVPITIRRDGEKLTFLVRLDGVHTEKELIDLVSPEKAPTESNPKPSKEKKSPSDSPAKRTPDSELQLPKELQQVAPDKQLVEKMLTARKGFANYYFNALHQDEIWSAVRTLGDFSKTDSTWRFTGKIAGESTPISMTITDADGELRLGTRLRKVSYSRDVSDVVAERRDTGLLIAMRGLRDYLRQGPETLGDTTYLGTMPVFESTSTALSEQPEMDVLQSLWFDAKLRISHRDNGEIALIEVFGDIGNDPVEVYLSDYQPADSAKTDSESKPLRFPTRIRLQYGSEPVLLLEVAKSEFYDVSSGNADTSNQDSQS